MICPIIYIAMFIRASLALLKCFGCFGRPYMHLTDGRKEMEQFVYRKIGHSIERPSYFFLSLATIGVQPLFARVW